jgi:pyruvate dehydrogenase E1 component alpha subunit
MSLTKLDLIDFERMLADRYDDGHYPYLVHFSGGNEDQLIELFKEIKPGDWIFSTHRSHYHYLLAGGSMDHLESLIARGKSMFVFDRERNFYTSSILAATPAIAAGVAWALKRKGSTRKVWCFIGDGAADEGHFYEAARYVEGFDLPCTFIIEDNNRSVSACKDERWGCYEEPCQFRCVRRYHYTPNYPHGGSGTSGWLKFKCKAELERTPIKKDLDFDLVDVGMKYKDAVKQSMDMLAAAGAIFIGYNVRHGSAYGTLNDIPMEQRLETPVAENLMAGLAMGMSLEGFRPVLFFERHDFIYNALDALVNQADKVEIISEGQFRFPLIIRAVVGGVTPFYAGITHTSDLTELCSRMFSFPVVRPETSGEVLGVYRAALNCPGPVLISEPKDLHEAVC